MRSFGRESLHGPVTFSSFYGFIFPGVFQVFYNTACNPLFLLKDRPVLIPASAITNSDALARTRIKKRDCSRRSDGWKPWVVREVKKWGALELELSPSPLSRFHLSLEPQVAQAGLPVLEQATLLLCRNKDNSSFSPKP